MSIVSPTNKYNSQLQSSELQWAVNNTHNEILKLLSDSISKRTGEEIVLTDIMQYNQYRPEVDKDAVFVDKWGKVIPHDDIMFGGKQAA